MSKANGYVWKLENYCIFINLGINRHDFQYFLESVWHILQSISNLQFNIFVVQEHAKVQYHIFQQNTDIANRQNHMIPVYKCVKPGWHIICFKIIYLQLQIQSWKNVRNVKNTVYHSQY